MNSNNKTDLKKIIIAMLLLSSILYTTYTFIGTKFLNSKNEGLSVHFIDVGQGDSTLIITPNNKTILIDAGDESHAKNVVSHLNSFDIKKLDLVIATHPDADHIGGMDKVIKQFDIGVFSMPQIVADTNQFREIVQELENKNIQNTPLYMYDEVDIDNKIEFEILSPMKGKKYSDRNDNSIVVKITYKNNSFLLMGDATMENEIDIINNFDDIKVDVLKLGHHGSSTSTSNYFLEKTSPQIGVISCGLNNKYSHPHKEVLNLLQKYKIGIFRMDKQSTVVLNSDGNKITSKTKPIYK